MSALRDEIRAILREEFAALKGEVPCIPTREVVRVANSADLMRFAQDLVARAADPVFAARVARGEMGFELAAQAPAGGPIVSGPAKPPADTIDKALITERDISAISGARHLKIARGSRLTPLARDEARRRGIRIERSKA